MRANAYVIDGQPSAAHYDPGPRSVHPVHHSVDDRLDHFIERDGIRFAGTHLLLDFFGAQRLDDLDLMDAALRSAVEAAGAISVHTWPERDYAAFDIFMCGDAQPELGVEILREQFMPSRTEILEQRRGVIDGA